MANRGSSSSAGGDTKLHQEEFTGEDMQSRSERFLNEMTKRRSDERGNDKTTPPFGKSFLRPGGIHFLSQQPISRGTRRRSEGILDLRVLTSLGPVRVYCRRQLRSAPGRGATELRVGIRHSSAVFLFSFFCFCCFLCCLSI